jgi:hypothetical protein
MLPAQVQVAVQTQVAVAEAATDKTAVLVAAAAPVLS